MRDAKEQFPDMAEKIVTVTTTIHDEERADAALAAIKKAGFVVVPAEPTEAMVNAVCAGSWGSMEDDLRRAKAANYRAMIEAANAPT